MVIFEKYSLTTTTFILNVVDQNGCKNNASKIVNAKPLPFIAYNTPIVCLGKKPVISVDRSRSVADYYEWPDNSQNNTSWTSPDALTNEREFTFKAYSNGCPSKNIYSFFTFISTLSNNSSIKSL